MSQRALAQAAGVPQPAIARIETGRVSPRVDTLARLLTATGWAIGVAPALGQGVDRTLIHAALTRSPEERVTAAGEAGRNLAAYLTEVRRGTRR